MTNAGDDRDERTSRLQRERLELTAERIEQIQARIREGAYASDAVLQATARAILDRRAL